MHNDPELSGKYLGTISADFVKVADTLKEASYQIRKANFKYPVFPLCKEHQPIGQILLRPEIHGTAWHYYASFLDEFIQRGLIVKDKIEAKHREASENMRVMGRDSHYKVTNGKY